MKRLLLLISFSILCLFSFTQTNVQQDPRVNQILKTALASKKGYYIYGRTGTAGFINIAVLNQSSHTLCWFTCHGRLFDSTKLTYKEFEQVTSKQLDPFVLYQNICDNYLAYISFAKDIYRVYGDKQLFDKLNSNYRAVFAMEGVRTAKTPLQKLIAIENVRKNILTQLAYLNCSNPFGLESDPLLKVGKEQAGAMVQTKDSTVYYNIDPTSAVAKISLYKKSDGQLYIQNRFSEVIDSVAIQPEKYDLLQKEKTDVFLLYRGWLEMQWQGALSAIRRQGTGLYNQVNAQNEKEVKELYNQLIAIGVKINQLNSPEAKSIEQAVYNTYRSETSEISYIPLLGIGYNLIQTRGLKEYELTNLLGNVLATVSDKKIGVSSPSNSSLVDHYEPDVVSAQDYYPFGMLQPGRSYLSQTDGGRYRYGFNGKENDNEVKGEGNQQDYGMRVYDPRLGRFLSEDPLTKKYPELTPYQFASNTPLQAIDLDGLEAFFVPGTNSGPERWTENAKALEGTKTLLKLTNNKYYYTQFDWDAPVNNREKTRARAAQKLANFVMAHRIKGEEITLIGHSHGANVAIQASKLIFEKTGQKVNIISIGAPAYNGKGDVENPETQKKYINDHIALWNRIDGVSGGLAGDDNYTNSTITTNVEINVDQWYLRTYPGYNEFGQPTNTGESDMKAAHSFDVQHPEAIQKAIDNKLLRKLKPVQPQAAPAPAAPAKAAPAKKS